MSLVQPARPPNATGNNVGVKRPYQLMINSAAHNSGTDGSYPGRIKNMKLDKETLMEELSEDNPVSCFLRKGKYPSSFKIESIVYRTNYTLLNDFSINIYLLSIINFYLILML